MSQAKACNRVVKMLRNKGYNVSPGVSGRYLTVKRDGPYCSHHMLGLCQSELRWTDYGIRFRIIPSNGVCELRLYKK